MKETAQGRNENYMLVYTISVRRKHASEDWGGSAIGRGLAQQVFSSGTGFHDTQAGLLA